MAYIPFKKHKKTKIDFKYKILSTNKLEKILYFWFIFLFWPNKLRSKNSLFEMKNLLSLILLVSCLVLSAFGSLTSNPTINLFSLKRIFEGVKPYSDLANAFFSIKGLHLLGENLLDAQNAKVISVITNLFSFFLLKLLQFNLIFEGIM